MERRKFTREFKLEAGEADHGTQGNSSASPARFGRAWNRLRREVIKLKAVRDIFKNAAACFAKEAM
ncbi:MAG: hypothetical protein ABJB49_07195 [Nitrospirota bacterium]